MPHTQRGTFRVHMAASCPRACAARFHVTLDATSTRSMRFTTSKQVQTNITPKSNSAIGRGTTSTANLMSSVFSGIANVIADTLPCGSLEGTEIVTERFFLVLRLP